MTVIKAIHASARALGLDEDTRRDLYQRETGKRSLKLMKHGEQRRVLDALRKQGAAPAPGGRKQLTGPYAKKLQALWISAWNLGIVRNKDDKAMLAFIARQTGIANTAFLRDEADAYKAVEALKKWLEREGKVDWSVSKYRAAWMNDPRGQVAIAQVGILVRNELLSNVGRLVDTLGMFHPQGCRYPEQFTDHDWIEVQQAMGRVIRDGWKTAAEKKAG